MSPSYAPAVSPLCSPRIPRKDYAHPLSMPFGASSSSSVGQLGQCGVGCSLSADILPAMFMVGSAAFTSRRRCRFNLALAVPACLLQCVLRFELSSAVVRPYTPDSTRSLALSLSLCFFFVSSSVVSVIPCIPLPLFFLFSSCFSSSSSSSSSYLSSFLLLYLLFLLPVHRLFILFVT